MGIFPGRSLWVTCERVRDKIRSSQHWVKYEIGYDWRVSTKYWVTFLNWSSLDVELLHSAAALDLVMVFYPRYKHS